MKKIDVNEQPVSSAIVCDESGDTLLLQKWRKFVEEAKTGGQVMLAIQVTICLKNFLNMAIYFCFIETN